MQFRVIRGRHAQAEPVIDKHGNQVMVIDNTDPERKRKVVARKNVVYSPGDVVETNINLEKKFNQPGSIKFERIHRYSDDDSQEERTQRRRRRPQAQQPQAQLEDIEESHSQDPESVSDQQDVDESLSPPQEEKEDATTKNLRRALGKMSKKSLLDIASEEEIDIGAATTKEELIEVLLKGM